MLGAYAAVPPKRVLHSFNDSPTATGNPHRALLRGGILFIAFDIILDIYNYNHTQKFVKGNAG